MIPPKGAKAPKVTKPKKAKKNDGISNCHRALKGDGDGGEESVLIAEIKAAFIGYTKYPVLSAENKIVFRKWNDRQIKETAGKNIMESLKNTGMQGFIPENMIAIVLRKTDIEADKPLTLDKMAGSELPEMKLKKDQVEIFGASGQHRVWALRKLMGEWETKVKTLDSQMKRIRGKGNLTEGDVKLYTDLRQRVASRMGDLEQVGWWGILLDEARKRTDEGRTFADQLLKKGTAAAMRLSQNKALFEFGETDEEKLVAFVRLAMEAKEEGEARYQLVMSELREKAKGQNSKISRVIHCEFTISTLMRLLKFSPEFWMMPAVTVPWMSSLVDVHVGYVEVEKLVLLLRQKTDKSKAGDVKVARAKVAELQRKIEEGPQGHYPHAEEDGNTFGIESEGRKNIPRLERRLDGNTM
ncbi:hypothetical protein BJ138DRAFT_1189251 [Hygrophoropsis aurantiaca]|uniref:Uncharacterized protein n=1 Tax=Hygrophoropsis aurantiaca TaxID=72124 RepID=A0ACB7ZSH1_9AGAM|nr:hypothetical protein BJ138DRAFT_1189251 [Hygrophoropsis aurantiaca]